MMEAGNTRAIATAYQIATLTYPSFEVIELLKPLPFERVLELLLIMRQSPQSIQENWTAETMPEKVDRHIENLEENIYVRQGYSIDEAREIVQKRRRDEYR